MRANTCKFNNGSFVNTHCEAGVCYKDVTPDPDDINGSAWRLPCSVHIDSDFSNDGQRENYERRGTCEKFELPTAGEVAEHEAAMDARFKEVCESLEKGVVPEGVMVCGSSWGMGITTFPDEPTDSEFSSIYGFGMGGDPHDFDPDYESNTEDEIKAWEKAKAECKCGRNKI